MKCNVSAWSSAANIIVCACQHFEESSDGSASLRSKKPTSVRILNRYLRQCPATTLSTIVVVFMLPQRNLSTTSGSANITLRNGPRTENSRCARQACWRKWSPPQFPFSSRFLVPSQVWLCPLEPANHRWPDRLTRSSASPNLICNFWREALTTSRVKPAQKWPQQTAGTHFPMRLRTPNHWHRSDVI